MHWAAKYVGIPFLAGGRSLPGIDCWGLVYLVYPQEFNITVPELPNVSVDDALDINRHIVQEVRQEWKEIAAPVDGCVVAMSQKEVMHHVGLWVDADGGKVLHTWKGERVVADTLRRLQFRGFRTLKYYQHHLWRAQ